MFFIDINSILIILLNVFVLLLFGLLVVSVFRLYKVNTKEEEQMIKHKAYKKALEVLADSQHKSMQIVQSSTAKAHQMLKDARYLSSESKEELEEQIRRLSQEQVSEMKNVTDKMLGTYLRALEEEKDKGIQAINELTEGVGESAEEELAKFHEALKDEVVETEEEANDRVAADLSKSKERIKEYEAGKLREVDANINKILSNVAHEVLGKALSLEDQQDLVLQALEDAKRENIFKA